MKRYLIIMLLSVMTGISALAQQQISVNYDKTVHLIFKSRIMYVDLGSESIMASMIDNLPNILRIKAAERNFKGETNMSVILEDNTLFSFNILYSDTLDKVTYHPDIKTDEPEIKKKGTCQDIYEKNLDRVSTIGYMDYGITIQIRSIYMTEANIFIHLAISNKSNISFTLDNISFSIGNKRNKFSSEEIYPIEEYTPERKIESKGSAHMVYMLDRFILKNNDALQIMIFEKTGSRNVTFPVDGKLFTRAIEKL